MKCTEAKNWFIKGAFSNHCFHKYNKEIVINHGEGFPEEKVMQEREVCCWCKLDRKYVFDY